MIKKEGMSEHPYEHDPDLGFEVPDIFLAAMRDDVPLLERALLSGEDINQVDPASGATPLHFATYFGSVNFVRRAAQEQNLQVQVYDREGRTPYLYAAERRDAEIKKIIFDLMDFGGPKFEAH